MGQENKAHHKTSRQGWKGQPKNSQKSLLLGYARFCDNNPNIKDGKWVYEITKILRALMHYGEAPYP